jgi:hypothetical protein
MAEKMIQLADQQPRDYQYGWLNGSLFLGKKGTHFYLKK